MKKEEKKSRENPMDDVPMINQRDMRTIVEFLLHQYTCVHRQYDVCGVKQQL